MKEFKIDGCISVPEDMTEDEFWNQFIDLIETKQWLFGGGINEYTYDTNLFPDSWDKLYNLWENKEITKEEFMTRLNLKPGTFYNLLKLYRLNITNLKKKKKDS